MRKCLSQTCDKSFEPNKPKQVFCNVTCRVNHFRQKQKETPVSKPKKSTPLPVEKTKKEVKIQDLTKGNKEVKAPVQPKSNYAVSVPAKKEEKSSEPKNLSYTELRNRKKLGLQ